jgi:hypothetical protein
MILSTELWPSYCYHAIVYKVATFHYKTTRQNNVAEVSHARLMTWRRGGQVTQGWASAHNMYFNQA